MQLLFIGLLISCTHAPLVVESGGCQTKARYLDFELTGANSYEYEFWSHFQPHKFSFAEFFEKEKIPCSQIKAVQFEVVQNASDVWLSLAPGASRARLKIYILEGASKPDDEFLQQFD